MIVEERRASEICPDGHPTILPEPKIIPRSQHPISRADIDVEVLKVLYRLHHNGYKAYLVGGSVRDLWLAKKPKDFDIATDAHPQEIRRLFRNSRTIGRRFRLVQVFFKGGKVVEVSTFRRRSEFDGEADVLAPNNTFGTPAEDAQRRDLTINGLFYDIGDFSLLDYVGGLEDLRNSIIRVIGCPEVRFRRDPVRMLRVLRHAARTGFTIDPATWAGIQAHRHLIRLCNRSRLRDELVKDFKGGFCSEFTGLMLESGLLAAMLPHLEEFLQDQAILAATKKRLQEIFARVDDLTRSQFSFSETFFWTAFLIPFLEIALDIPFQEISPEVAQQYVINSLQILDFARGRRDDVVLLWLTAAQIQRQLQTDQRLPARLKRRSCFAEAWVLTHVLAGAPADCFAALVRQGDISPTLPEGPPTKKRRRTRHSRARKKVFPS